MDNILIITILESVYLLFMFFIFKTPYSFSSTTQDTKTSALGQMFVHNTGSTENKICVFGKIMAVIATILGFVRYYYIKDNKTAIIYGSLAFAGTCIVLAFIMNLNALVYISPLLLTETYILYQL